MPDWCIVKNCYAFPPTGKVSFHSFPKDSSLYQKWVLFVQKTRPDWIDKGRQLQRICSRHFCESDFENYNAFKNGFAKMLKLTKSAVPSIYPEVKQSRIARDEDVPLSSSIRSQDQHIQSSIPRLIQERPSLSYTDSCHPKISVEVHTDEDQIIDKSKMNKSGQMVCFGALPEATATSNKKSNMESKTEQGPAPAYILFVNAVNTTCIFQPTVCGTWLHHQRNTSESLKQHGTSLEVCGDSSGQRAKYGAHSNVEVNANKLVSSEVVQQTARCCVPGCYNNNAIFKYPAKGPMYKKWTDEIKKHHQSCRDRNWKPCARSVICPEHFTDDDFHHFAIGGTEVRTNKLKSGAIPTENLTCRRHKTKETAGNLNYNPLFDENIDILPLRSEEKFILESSDNPVVINTQLKLEVNTLTQEYQALKDEYAVAAVDRENLENNNQLTHDLTGLITYAAFAYISDAAKGHLEQDFVTNIRHGEQLVLTLTKLRHNIADRLLSIVYSIPVDEVCNIYLSWIKAMAAVVEADRLENLESLSEQPVDKEAETRCFYVGYLAMSKTVAKPTTASQTAWITDPLHDFETTTEQVVCVVSDQGHVVHISHLVKENTPVMPILQEARSFMDILTDHDKVYLIPMERTVLKRDIELGVVLDVDEEKDLSTNDPSYTFCEQILKSASEWGILTNACSEYSDDFREVIIKLCTSLVCMSHRGKDVL